MEFEKPKPFKNEYGQINDPEIARVMAEKEIELRSQLLEKKRKTAKDTKNLEFDVEIEGLNEHNKKKFAYEDEKLSSALEKIKSVALSKEEKEVLRQYWNQSWVFDTITGD